MSTKNISYGPVYITDGPYAGRIGYYDDDEFECSEHIDWDDVVDDDAIEGQYFAIIYFGDFFLTDDYFFIPDEYVREVTIADLMQR